MKQARNWNKIEDRRCRPFSGKGSNRHDYKTAQKIGTRKKSNSKSSIIQCSTKIVLKERDALEMELK